MDRYKDLIAAFPIFGKLTPDQLKTIDSTRIERSVKKGTVIHNGSVECTGLLMVRSGQLRAYYLSGEAVREAAQFYKVPADHILVIYDDISLPVGKLRVRPSGSAGGHNGIKNIIAHLGTQDFPRVKIGVAAPGDAGDMIDWVIGVPSQAERKILAQSFEKALDAAECIIIDGCQKAMNGFN